MVSEKRRKFGPLPMRVLRKLRVWVWLALYRTLKKFRYFGFLGGYENSQGPILFSIWLMQKVVGFNRSAYWGVHFTSKVVQPKHIVVGKHTNPGIEPGCYIQGIGKVYFGDYTKMAANSSIISSNHDVNDLDSHIEGVVKIGSYCWIGANCVVLPGVELGDFTIVGAGSVVTRSHPEGYCVIAGNPARKIKDLDPEACKRTERPHPFIGYMPAAEFETFRRDRLWV